MELTFHGLPVDNLSGAGGNFIRLKWERRHAVRAVSHRCGEDAQEH
jgi:hypothetical protein